MTLEREVENEIVAYTESLGGIAVKVQAIGRRGFPDRLLLFPGGKCVLLEIKKPKGGRKSPHQLRYEAIFKGLKTPFAFVKTLSEAKRVIKKYVR